MITTPIASSRAMCSISASVTDNLLHTEKREKITASMEIANFTNKGRDLQLPFDVR
jgi:hypothetical protein